MELEIHACCLDLESGCSPFFLPFLSICVGGVTLHTFLFVQITDLCMDQDGLELVSQL